MKKQRLLGLLCAGITAAASLPIMPLSTAYADDQCDRGVTPDGYNYELWNQDWKGQCSWTVGERGTYECSWSGIQNVLFRTGKKFDNYPQWDTLDGIAVDYEMEYYQPNGNSYLCVYGWTKNPLAEYYIVEDYGNWRPPGTFGGMRMVGELTIDGGTYEIYTGTHDGPSIEPGVTHFNQYWSVRKDGDLRTKGAINIDKHFEAWEKQGIKMGGLYEVALNVEGYQSSGRAKVSKNDLYIGNVPDSIRSGQGGDGPAPGPSEPEVKYTAPTGTGKGVSDDFEGTGTSWTNRGDSVKYGFTSDFVHGGKQSLYVTGRTDSWNGVSVSSDELKAGGTYDFSGYVGYQNDTYSSIGFTLGLQYDLNGTTNYDNLVDATGSSGKWAQLSKEFTIPAGATSISLYIQTDYTEKATAKDKISFFVDDITLTGNGVTTTGTTDSSYGGSTGTTGGDPQPRTGDGFKDYFANYFKIGTSVSPGELNSGANFLKTNYNSITPENELKPENILDQNASKQKGNNVNPQVNLYKAAQTLKFCEDNGISMRGHTFVWYSQTPEWFFRENFDDNGAYVSKEIMNQRLENFIKNTFEAIAAQYPKLDLYAYDVCNELFKTDGGGLRPKQSSDRTDSAYARVYGENNDEFIINAFTYARKYAPKNCKLYINDFNEYIDAKTNNIYDIAMKLKEKGLIDGIGMQSHLSTQYPPISQYKKGLEKFLSTGLDVQITELDIEKKGNESAQFQLFLDVFTLAMQHADQISSLTLWGTTDNVSWRSGETPLLFTQGYNAKPVYAQILALTEKINPPAGSTTSSSTTTTTTTTTTSTTTSTTTTTTTTTTSTTKPAPAGKKGDLNGDGVLDVKDAVLLARLAGGDSEVPISADNKANADINGDGTFDTLDLTMLLQAIVGATTL